MKNSGAYFKEVVPKQKYQLTAEDGTPLAMLNLIVSKSGSETATLFAMNRMDIGLASSTAFMSGIDKGTAMKILCPLHVDGMSMVFPADSDINGYEDVASGQVGAWVGPAPHPSVAEFKKAGHIGLDSRDLPPSGEWNDFPCCVMGASQKLIDEHPAIVQAMTDLMSGVAAWSNKHKTSAAQISAAWLGVPAEAIEKSTIIYTTDPTDNWLKGEDTFLTMLNSMNKFKGGIKGQDIAAASPLLFDFSFVNKSLNK